MVEIITILLIPASGIFLVSGIIHPMTPKRLSNALAWVGAGLVATAAFCGWLEIRRLPVYGQLEANLHIAFTLAFCMAFSTRWLDTAGVQPWGRLLVAALLIRALAGHDGLTPDYFLYQFPSVQLFFALRLTAGGVLILTFLLYVRNWIRALKSGRNNHAADIRAASCTLMLGAILFLASEFSGSLWCAMGYGDTWHWTSNFLKSAAIFLLLLFPLHAPRWLKENGRLSGVGSLCTLAVILEIVL